MRLCWAKTKWTCHVGAFRENCLDESDFGSKTREHVILNGLDTFFHHGNEDWACDAWNTLALGQNTWLRICIISEKINDNSGRNVMLVITIVFLTPAFLNIHSPVPLEFVRLHLKDESMIENKTLALDMKLRLEVAAIFTMRHSYQSSHFYYAKRRKKEHLSDSESRDISNRR